MMTGGCVGGPSYPVVAPRTCRSPADDGGEYRLAIGIPARAAWPDTSDTSQPTERNPVP